MPYVKGFPDQLLYTVLDALGVPLEEMKASA